MSAAATPAPIPHEIAQRAVEWLIELQADASPVVHENLQRWRAAHPDHERAWQRIETVNGALRGLSALPSLPSPLSSAIAHATLAAPASPRRRQAIKSLSILIFAGAGAWLIEERTPWRTWSADHRTAVGESRTVTLADGSSLMLNTSSAVNISFTNAERRVRLIAGEIFIATAKDAADRPFLVETAQGEAQALGTRYSVFQQAGRTDVAVFEGAVEIRPRGNTASLLLQAGQQTGFTSSAIDAVQPADRNGLAWTGGFLIAKGMRLEDFLAELSRYSTRPLSCAPAIADLRVSGSYPLTDIDKVIDTLSAMLSLEVQTVRQLWGWQAARVNLAPRRGRPAT